MSEKPAHAYRSHAMQDDYCEQLLPHDSSKGTEWIACGLPRSAHPASPPEPAPESEEPNPDRLVIHHMTLMLSDFGRHEPECCCSGDKTPHAADCEDCECGLADAIKFGVEQSGIPLEPDPPTPEEEARFQEIEKRAVEKALAEFKRPARPDPAPEPEKLRRMAEEINSLAYAHAVTMHESIISGRGAVGWRDEELTQELLVHLEEIVRVSADEVGGVDEYSAIQILRHWGLSPESAPEPAPSPESKKENR